MKYTNIFGMFNKNVLMLKKSTRLLGEKYMLCWFFSNLGENCAIVQLCNDFCTIFTFVLQRFYKDRLFFRPVVYVSNKGTRNICKLFQKCTTSKNTFELMSLLRNRKCKFVDCKRGALLDYSGGPTNKSLFLGHGGGSTFWRYFR